MHLTSKLPEVGTTIFTVMSALAAEHGALNLSQGFPNFSSSPRLIDLVCKYMHEGYNQYAPMPGVPALRRRIADKISDLYGREVDPQEEITITAGASEAIFSAVLTFVHPGDEVIILEPAFDSYRPAVELAGGRVIACRLPAPHYRIDWEELARLHTAHTRMIIINTPHNPTGTVLSTDDLIRLEQLTEGTKTLVLSDEVYEHLVFDGNTHRSALGRPGLWPRLIATYSFGKTFHNTGWKVGYVVMPAPLMHEFRKVHQYNVFSVHTPTQHALADFLEDPQEYLQLGNFYQQKRDRFLQAMEGSRLRPLVCEGTYFHLFDFSAVSNEPDTDFARRLTIDHGVAAIPVSVFCKDGRDDKVIRLCFAKTDDVLDQAAERLREV